MYRPTIAEAEMKCKLFIDRYCSWNEPIYITCVQMCVFIIWPYFHRDALSHEVGKEGPGHLVSFFILLCVHVGYCEVGADI